MWKSTMDKKAGEELKAHSFWMGLVVASWSDFTCWNVGFHKYKRKCGN